MEWRGGGEPSTKQTHFSEGNTFQLDNNQLLRKKKKKVRRRKKQKPMCSRLCLCRRASPPAAASSSTAGGGPGATAPPTDNLRALELNLAGLLFSAPLFGSSCWCHTASQGKTASPHLYFASVKPEAPKYPPKLTRNRIGANISFLPWLRWFESDCLKQKPAS